MFFRSLICKVLFFSTLSVMSLFSIFLAPFSQDVMRRYWFMMANVLSFISKYIGNIDAKLIGAKNISRNHIFASRHESLWETMYLITVIKNPVFVLKKELTDIPFFGFMLKRVGSISIDRSQGAAALMTMARQVSAAIKEGRSVIIFPEGTRRQPGSPIKIKKGIAMLYRITKCGVVPVVLNSGKFWGKHKFMLHPGTVTVKFLDVIEPGIDADEFSELLEHKMNEEMQGLE